MENMKDRRESPPDPNGNESNTDGMNASSGNGANKKGDSETDNKAENYGQSDDEQNDLGKNGTSSETDTKKSLELANDKYLRLYSEFDNYRKRSLRERVELIKTASEDVLKSLLPVVDDFERAMKAMESGADPESVKEGEKLIYNKLKNVLSQKGLEPFESIGRVFDPELMEAI